MMLDELPADARALAELRDLQLDLPATFWSEAARRPTLQLVARRGDMTAKPLLDAKSFATLRARAAQAGIQLLRTDAADGPVRLLVENQDRIQELRTLDDVEALIAAGAR